MTDIQLYLCIGGIVILTILSTVLFIKYKHKVRYIASQQIKSPDEINAILAKKEENWRIKSQDLEKRLQQESAKRLTISKNLENANHSIAEKNEESEIFRKKITALEKEKEISQNIIKGIKEKNAEQAKELNKLNDDYLKATHQISDLESDNQELKKNLSSEIAKVSCVKALLSAPIISNQQLSSKHQSVDRMVDLVINDLRPFLNNYENSITLPDNIDKTILLNDDLFQWEMSAKKHWTHMKTCVAFTGLFSSGKTSIINSIVRSKCPNAVMMPVDNRPTTTIPTYISNGPKEKFAFYTPLGELKEVSKDSFSSITKEVISSIGNISSILKYFVADYCSDKLKHFSILDTPGFDSGSKSEDERTYSVIRNCDAIFWVIDVNSSVPGETTLAALKKIHSQSVVKSRPLYIILNKTDLSTTAKVSEYKKAAMEKFNKAGIQVTKIIEYNQHKDISIILEEILKIERIARPELFLDNLNLLMTKIKKSIDSNTAALSRKFREDTVQVNNREAKLNTTITMLGSDASEIAGLPELIERWKIFGGDHYKLSKDDGKQLISLAKSIRDSTAPKIKTSFMELSKSISVCQKTSDAIASNNIIISRFSKIFNEYTSLKKEFS